MALKIVFRADSKTATKVKKKIPGARFRQGSLELKVEGQHPGEVAEKVRSILESIRAAT